MLVSNLLVTYKKNEQTEMIGTRRRVDDCISQIIESGDVAFPFPFGCPLKV
jgi:hypothetical protein